VRIEILDAARVVPGATDGLLHDLAWLGMDWMAPSSFQATRLGRIRERRRTSREWIAYPVFARAGAIAAVAKRAARRGSRTSISGGTCRGRFSSTSEAETCPGKTCGVRFIAKPDRTAYVDGFSRAVRERTSPRPSATFSLRERAAASIHLEVVVDDAEKPRHRGASARRSPAEHGAAILLREALGVYPVPLPVPLVGDAEGHAWRSAGTFESRRASVSAA